MKQQQQRSYIKSGLYNRALHADILGSLFPQFTGCFWLRYSRHAMREALDDKFGPVLHPPRRICIGPEHIVEITVEDSVAMKAVVRLPLDDRRDLVLVLGQPQDTGECKVITLWTNRKSDNHATLKLNS